MTEKNKKIVEKSFTEADGLMYNGTTEAKTIEAQVKAQLASDRYLPTNDIAFKKAMASPMNKDISAALLKDIARYDPLGALQISKLSIETPYNHKDKNELSTQPDYTGGILYTEVDYACSDSGGVQFLVELQLRRETHLEKRTAYNVSERFTSNYAGGEKKEAKYASLRPVVAIGILKESYYKNDPHPIRFLRHHDASINVYKKDLLMGLEIYLELEKDTSSLPKYLQDIFQLFRTGEVPADAADYLRRIMAMMEKVNFTPDEREAANAYIRAQLKRASEDDYIREEEREKADIRVQIERKKLQKAEDEKAELQKKSEDEKAELQKKSEDEKAELQKKSEDEKAELQKKSDELQKKADAEKIGIAKKLLSRGLSMEDVAEDTGLDYNEINKLI